MITLSQFGYKHSDVLRQEYAMSSLQVDVPFFYSFNRSFNTFTETNLGRMRCIGTNLRFEVSVLNTIIRREQNRRGLSLIKVGSYTSYGYSNLHQGNSLRTLMSTLENRECFVYKTIQSKKYLMVVLGVNALRSYNGFYLQRITNMLNKIYFTKTSGNIRIGYIHSSIGSIAFSFIGIQPTTSTKYFPKQTVINVNQPLYSKNFFN